jgi:hypothetical protein
VIATTSEIDVNSRSVRAFVILRTTRRAKKNGGKAELFCGLELEWAKEFEPSPATLAKLRGKPWNCSLNQTQESGVASVRNHRFLRY